MVIGILNIKIIALLTGPAGMTLIGQLQNFLQLGGSVSGLGFKNGIIKYIAQNQKNKYEQQKILYTALVVLLISSLLCSLVIYIFSNKISVYIFNQNKSLLIKFTFIYLLTSNIVNFAIYYLNGLQKTRNYIYLNVFTSISGFIISLSAIYFFGLTGILWAQLFIFILSFPIACHIIFKSLKGFSTNCSKNVFKKLSNYSIMTLVAGILSPITLIIIRNQIITYTSLENAGYWEGINKISTQYISLITVSFSYYFLPVLSKLKTHNEIWQEIIRILKFFIPVCFLGGLSIYLLKDTIIFILFDSKFQPMSELFIWQTSGDFFKILSWIIAYVFIAGENVKTYLFTEIFSVIAQIGLSRYFLYLNMPVNIYYFYENLIYFIMMGTLFYFMFKHREDKSS